MVQRDEIVAFTNHDMKATVNFLVENTRLKRSPLVGPHLYLSSALRC